eukprot:maker-scaffold_74-snap-gene-0.18-mRNA-1 protein AED:0.00 eAED:0.00 QI:52/1/1/1/1/1/3/234/344
MNKGKAEEKSGSDVDAAAELKLVRSLSRQHSLTGIVVHGVKSSGSKGTKPETTPKKKGGKTQLAGWKHFTAGACAGACEVLCTMPLDVVKTQMQINPGKYRNPIHAMKTIKQTDGIRALYFGMPAFLLQTSGKAAIRFTAFAKTKQTVEKLLNIEGKGGAGVNLFCGLMAGAVEAAVWTTPTERLKVLKQSQIGGSGAKQGLFGSAVNVVKTGGVGSLFKGLVPTVLRQSSSVGIRFMLYDTVKSGINYFSGDEDGGVITYMAAGGTVGALSVTLNNPIDVVKNIAQSGKGDGLGTIGIMRQVYAANGFGGFFRGLSARVPRVFCGQAITFAAYEKIASILIKL